jgi:hypothetical protein
VEEEVEGVGGDGVARVEAAPCARPSAGSKQSSQAGRRRARLSRLRVSISAPVTQLRRADGPLRTRG